MTAKFSLALVCALNFLCSTVWAQEAELVLEKRIAEDKVLRMSRVEIPYILPSAAETAELERLNPGSKFVVNLPLHVYRYTAVLKNQKTRTEEVVWRKIYKQQRGDGELQIFDIEVSGNQCVVASKPFGVLLCEVATLGQTEENKIYAPSWFLIKESETGIFVKDAVIRGSFADKNLEVVVQLHEKPERVFRYAVDGESYQWVEDNLPAKPDLRPTFETPAPR